MIQRFSLLTKINMSDICLPEYLCDVLEEAYYIKGQPLTEEQVVNVLSGEIIPIAFKNFHFNTRSEVSMKILNSSKLTFK